MRSLQSTFGVIAVPSLEKFVGHQSVTQLLLPTEFRKSWIRQNQISDTTTLGNLVQRMKAVVV